MTGGPETGCMNCGNRRGLHGGHGAQIVRAPRPAAFTSFTAGVGVQAYFGWPWVGGTAENSGRRAGCAAELLLKG